MISELEETCLCFQGIDDWFPVDFRSVSKTYGLMLGVCTLLVEISKRGPGEFPISMFESIRDEEIDASSIPLH